MLVEDDMPTWQIIAIGNSGSKPQASCLPTSLLRRRR